MREQSCYRTRRMLRLLTVLIVAGAGMLAGTAQAQRRGSVEPLRETGRAFAAIAENAAKSVVGVRATRKQAGGQSQSPFGDQFTEEDFFDYFFRRQMPRGRQQLPQREAMAQGSGVIISEDGYILTNNHVVAEAGSVTIAMATGKEYDAEIVGTDARSDVAVLKIDADNLPFLEMADSDDLQVGEWVLAVGNPFGSQFSHSVTAGIVSAKGRSGLGVAAYEDFIQTDAAINPGNSGGPLLDIDGRIVGINTAIISRTGGNMGIGLAVPSNMAKFVYQQLREKGTISRGFLGVSIQTLTPELAESFGLDQNQGVVITDVTADSAADKAGLRRGDVVISLAGKPVLTANALQSRIATTAPGTKVELTILRDGKRRNVQVELGERPAEEQIAGMQGGAAQALTKLGIDVQELNEDIAERLGFEGEKGVVITRVLPGSPAADAGLQPGTLILEVNRERVSNAKEFAEAVNAAIDRGVILLLVTDGQFTRYVTIRVPQGR